MITKQKSLAQEPNHEHGSKIPSNRLKTTGLSCIRRNFCSFSSNINGLVVIGKLWERLVIIINRAISRCSDLLEPQ